MLTHIAYETEGDLVIAGMVAEGFGISILPNDHLIGTMNLEVLPLDDPDAGKTANLNFAFRCDTFSHNKNSLASIGISDQIQSCFIFFYAMLFSADFYVGRCLCLLRQLCGLQCCCKSSEISPSQSGHDSDDPVQ